MPDVICLGNAVVDIIGKPVDRLPERGQLALLDTLETHVGGNGLNTAGALARLGTSVSLVSRVGDDLYGRFIAETLEAWGVDTRAVRRDLARATGLAFVAVDSGGERSFIHHPGANGVLSPADMDWDLTRSARIFHLAAFFVLPALDGEPAAGLLREARGHGLTTSLDVCWDRSGRWMDLLRPCLPHLDYFMPSEDEARHLAGSDDPRIAAQRFRDLGARCVIIKRGERGCLYSGPDAELAVPAFDVPVRDATGAGDSFIAGFLTAVGQGWDTEQALRFANAVGALGVQYTGAVTGIRSAAEVEAWMATARCRSA